MWQCKSCGASIKLLDPVGRVVVGLLTVLLGAGVPYVAVTSKVQDESERPWIVLLLAALVAALAVLLVRDTRRQRKHPLKP